jgi:hypothetical protein
MKKKQQVQVLIIMNFFLCLLMFITALITKAHGITPFAFMLLIGTIIIRFSGKSEVYINITKNKNSYESKINKPTFNLWDYLGKQYDRFIVWLNS